MTIDPGANDLLTRSGAPSAKFPTIGTTCKGTVLGAEKTQQTDIKGTPKFWDNGDPMYQVVVTLQTDERDPAIDDDNGERRVFVKGQMLTAVKGALKAAGASGLEIGGTLAVRYESDGTPKPGQSAPKQYVAQYQPAPAVSLGGGDLL